jgi:hypothetical protein
VVRWAGRPGDADGDGYDNTVDCDETAIRLEADSEAHGERLTITENVASVGAAAEAHYGSSLVPRPSSWWTAP